MSWDPEDRYRFRFADDDGWRPRSIRYRGWWWDYDPSDDLYHSRANRTCFGRPLQPRTLDWFTLREAEYVY